MSYSILSKPGTRLGPCLELCQHRDCAANRATAEAICPGCGHPIGYETKYSHDEGKLYHFTCLIEKIDKEQPAPTELDLVISIEAAEILGWNKRQVAEYIRRGTFPKPANKKSPRGRRVWYRQQILDFKEELEARKKGRGAKPIENPEGGQ